MFVIIACSCSSGWSWTRSASRKAQSLTFASIGSGADPRHVGGPWGVGWWNKLAIRGSRGTHC